MQYNWTKILNSQVVQNWKASKEIKSTPPQSSHNLLQYQKIIPKIKTSLASWRKEIPERRARQWDGSPIAPYLVVSTTATGPNLIRQVTDTTAFGLTGVLYRLAYRFFKSSSHPRRISYLLLFQTF